MSQRELFCFGLKGFLVWVFMSGLVWYFGAWLAKALFPMLQIVLTTMMPEIASSLKLVSSPSQLDDSIELSAWVLRPIYLNADHFIPPTTELKSSAHLLHTLVPLVIELAILLVWPVECWLQRIFLVLAGCLTAALVIVATLPAQLLGKIEISFQDIALIGKNPKIIPGYVDWMVFCEMGGRWLLAIIAAWFCIQLQRKLRLAIG